MFSLITEVSCTPFVLMSKCNKLLGPKNKQTFFYRFQSIIGFHPNIFFMEEVSHFSKAMANSMSYNSMALEQKSPGAEDWM